MEEKLNSAMTDVFPRIKKFLEHEMKQNNLITEILQSCSEDGPVSSFNIFRFLMAYFGEVEKNILNKVILKIKLILLIN